MRIHKQRRPTRRTELMHALLLSEEVALDMMFATVEYHVRALGIDVEIAIFTAYRAIAAGHFLRV